MIERPHRPHDGTDGPGSGEHEPRDNVVPLRRPRTAGSEPVAPDPPPDDAA